jgi:formate C-acetyltransferase
MFIEQGKKLPATPDGRLAGEEMSKNGSPVIGMDKKGITALIRSALATTPCQFTEGYGFDVMLHPTAVKGEDGLAAMRALLRTYDQGGGGTIQFNITDAATLRDAQLHPEKYPGLQIRVCGWNVLWNNIAKAEQEKYIERAENII